MNIDKSTPQDDDDSWWTKCDGECGTRKAKNKNPNQAHSSKTLYYPGFGHSHVLIYGKRGVIGSASLADVFQAHRQNDGIAVIGGHGVMFSEVEKITENKDAKKTIDKEKDESDRQRALTLIHKNCFIGSDN